MKNVLKSVLLCLLAISIFSCSKDDDDKIEKNESAISDKSFVTDNKVDFFINRDGTVDLKVNGKYNENSIGEVERRGFVYSTISNQDANESNTINTSGGGNVTGSIKNLPKNKSFFIRGFLQMKDGSFFYGNEIETSTNVDATSTRKIEMEMVTPESIAIEATSIVGLVKINLLEKESPIEIGFQYSIDNQFTNPTVIIYKSLSGNVMLTTYGENTDNLSPKTPYYFRPYAKYADGTTTNGGISTISISTKDDRIFWVSNNPDFFINRNGTVNITVSGMYNSGNTAGNLKRKGFIYSTISNQEANANNTVNTTTVGGMIDVANIENLPKDKTYFIRGFIEMNDGSFFYGNEIEVSTNVNASSTRKIKMEMITPESTAIEPTSIAIQVKVTAIEKESPIELGFQYSTSNNFTNATTVLEADIDDNTNFIVKTYNETVNNLTASTLYYFRPYAKYADGTITNGGTNVISVSTK